MFLLTAQVISASAPGTEGRCGIQRDCVLAGKILQWVHHRCSSATFHVNPKGPIQGKGTSYHLHLPYLCLSFIPAECQLLCGSWTRQKAGNAHKSVRVLLLLLRAHLCRRSHPHGRIPRHSHSGRTQAG